ncbi:MAG TPA: HD-GYP domain-containing protein [Solirubrobacteraceae bacterium]
MAEEELAVLRARLEETERAAAETQRQLERSMADLRDSYAATVRALADAVEARDAYTGGHAERVAAYGTRLARAMGVDVSGRPEIEFGFLLHDVGKVAIPDAILFKPAELTAEEEVLMRRHPVIGEEILRHVPWLGEGRDVVRSHHERWDGGGYPDGHAGEDIPLPARLFAVADTLDALTTDRPYRPATPLDEARERIAAGTGTQFDPAAVDALEDVPDDELEAIRFATASG